MKRKGLTVGLIAVIVIVAVLLFTGGSDYKFDGYTGKESSFVMDKKFKKALQEDKLIVNGFKIDNHFKKDEIAGPLQDYMITLADGKKSKYTKEKYDVKALTTTNGKTIMIVLPIEPGKISEKEFRKFYGKPSGTLTNETERTGYLYKMKGNKKFIALYDGSKYLSEITIASNDLLKTDGL